MTVSSSRRALLCRSLGLAAAGVSALMLGACGFQLRKLPNLQFKTIALRGFAPRSPLLEELRLNLNGTDTTRVVESDQEAQVIFEAVQDARERVVTSSTVAGQVRGFQLRARLKFFVRTPAGVTLSPLSEIVLLRDMSYSESIALAKDQEEAQHFRIMQSDIVAQVMRRLATVTLP
jgi:LPS-assembly lipoprotein